MRSLTLASLASLLLLITAQTANSTIRYMPFGDSITEIVCWRSKLWEKLQTTQWNSTAVDFVGSGKNENPSGCKDTKYDKDNEGHSGFLAIDIANKNQLDGWLKTNPADVITMHLGTNDIVQQSKVCQTYFPALRSRMQSRLKVVLILIQAAQATADILKAFTTLIGTMRTHNPNTKIIVAQIIPLGISATTYNPKVQDLNKAIPAWAQGLNKTESPIWVVDQYTGFTSSDLRDGVHPNDSGDTKMTNVWYPALVNALATVKAQKEREAKREVEFVA